MGGAVHTRARKTRAIAHELHRRAPVQGHVPAEVAMNKLVVIVSAMVVLAGCVGETAQPTDDEKDEQAQSEQQQANAPPPAIRTQVLRVRHDTN
jgi:hypothetical protein